jgi:hypothetical protein
MQDVSEGGSVRFSGDYSSNETNFESVDGED